MPEPVDRGPQGARDQSSRRNATVVGAAIFLSRIAGFLREAALALFLGVGPAVDAFRAAFRIPNVLQNLLGEGSLSASFIPVYTRLLTEDDEYEAGQVAGAVAGLLSLVAGATAVIGVVFAEPITKVLTPGFEGERLELTVTLMRILTPGAAFLVLSAWCLGILNSHRQFFLSYVAPVIWNAAQIAALVAFGVIGASDRSVAIALAWGAFVGGAAQFAVQVPAVRKLVRNVRPTLDHRRPAVRDVVRRLGPTMMGRGVAQILSYLDIFLASLLAVGAVSALGFAQIFYLLPISLFGIAIAAAELPELSRLTARAGPTPASREVRSRVEAALARVAFFVVLTTVLYVAAGDLIVGALLQRGEFGRGDTRLVWLVLIGYSSGLVATTTSRVLQNSFYALGDTRSPAIYASFRLVISATLGVALMFSLDRVVLDGPDLVGLTDAFVHLTPLDSAVRSTGDAIRLGAVGLAVASGISAWLELGLLLRRLNAVLGFGHRGGLFRGIRVGGGELGSALAAGLAAFVVAAGIRVLVRDLPALVAAPLAVAPALAAYVVVAVALGSTEGRDLLASARRKLA